MYINQTHISYIQKQILDKYVHENELADISITTLHQIIQLHLTTSFSL